MKISIITALVATLMVGLSSQASANDELRLSVESASDSTCIEYICVVSRNDEKLSELARFSRSTLDYMCDKNGIKKSECRPDAIVPKRTFLVVRDRS